MRFGVHTSIAGGLDRAVARAAELGCDCFQVFVANPRGWKSRRVGPGEAAAFCAAREQAGLGPVIVHLTYLPNLASPDKILWRKSLEALLEQYQAAALIHADMFVLHPGSSRGEDREQAMGRVAAALTRALDRIPDGPTLLLENTAGGGSSLGANPCELAFIAKAIDAGEHVSVCLDTAHAHASGFDLTRPGAMRSLRKQYRAAFGRHPICLVHLNDLKGELGSRHDQHQHIGKGAIGSPAFARIMATPGMRRLPYILETPINHEGDDYRNLARARQLGG